MKIWLSVTSIHWLVFSCLLCLCSLIISICCCLPFFFFNFCGKKIVVFHTCYHSIAWMLFIPLVPHPYPIIYPTSWSTSPLSPRWVTFNKADSVTLESCCEECGVCFMYSLNERSLLLVYLKSVQACFNCSDSRHIEKEIQS